MTATSAHGSSDTTAGVSTHDAARARTCNVALLGFGTVGSSVARILCERSNPHLRLTHVLNRNVARKKVDWLPSSVRWTENIDDVLSSDAGIVVEVMGGLQPSEDWIRRALSSGKSVVTANKQVIARCGPELISLARQMKQQIQFGASVAGGVPVISGLHDGLAGDELFKIRGILNGTCNYILSQIEMNGIPFATALREAQKLGFAEADPTDDIDGLDARAKLAILARVGLHCNVSVENILTRSIAAIDLVDFEYAKQLGCTIRQVSCAELQAENTLCRGSTGARRTLIAAGAGGRQPKPGSGNGKVWRRDGLWRPRSRRTSHRRRGGLRHSGDRPGPGNDPR